MLVSFLILSAAVQTASPSPKPTPGAEAKKVCRTERSTESRIDRKRVCRTQSEWDLLAEQTVNDLRYRGQSSR